MRKKTMRVLLAALSTTLVFSLATACAGDDGGDGGSSSSVSSKKSSSSSKRSSSKKSSSKSSSTPVAPPPEAPPASEPTLEVKKVGLSESKLDLDKYEYYDLSVILNDGDSFRISVNVIPGPVFLGWVLSFGGEVEITSPENVKKLLDELKSKF